MERKLNGRERSTKGKTMKRKTVKLIALTIMLSFSTSVSAAITDVSIVPSLPTPLDVISIDTSGVEGYGQVTITDSVFLIDGTFLQLDLSLNVGPYTVMTPWSHTEDIGTLPEGLYDLNVRTLEDSLVTDTYSTSFEVVPEPATMLLLGIGAIAIRRGKRIG